MKAIEKLFNYFRIQTGPLGTDEQMRRFELEVKLKQAKRDLDELQQINSRSKEWAASKAVEELSLQMRRYGISFKYEAKTIIDGERGAKVRIDVTWYFRDYAEGQTSVVATPSLEAAIAGAMRYKKDAKQHNLRDERGWDDKAAHWC